MIMMIMIMMMMHQFSELDVRFLLQSTTQPAVNVRRRFVSHEIFKFFFLIKASYRETKVSCDSSVGIALGYGLDDRGSRVRFPTVAGNFTLHYRVQNGSGAHPASYPMGTRGCLPGDKAAGA
jgi:hypothetical protein